MAENGAVFQEVIGVEFDSQQFAQSLDQLISVYEQKMQEMSGKGISASDVINTAGISELNSELADVAQTVRALSDAYTESFEKMGASVTDAVEKQHQLQSAIRETDSAASGAASSGGLLGDLKKGFLGSEDTSFAEMFGQVARFQLLWSGIGLAISAAMAPVKAIITGFKEGFQYLNDLEQKSYELTGVLDANVKFSNDIKQNFQDASKAAPQVVKALQDVAAATGLKPDNLFRAFSALTESGGMGAVNNLQELVQLTELFNLAMRAAGASVETSRLLISQMPNAMSGNITATSKWLEVLHMGPQEWNLMVKAGLAHHDLLQRLQTAMQPYLDATAQAALNEEELSSKADIIKKRWEAILASPLQEAYKKFLTDIVDLSDKHGKQIDSWLEKFARLDSSLAIQTLPHPGGVGSSLGERLAGALFMPESLNPDELKIKNPSSEDLMKMIVTAKHAPPAGKPNNDALDALKEHYGSELTKIKDAAKVDLASIDESEKAHTISVKEATDARIIIYQEEKKQIDELVASIRGQMSLVGGTTKARKAFGTALGDETVNADTQTSVDISKATGQLNAEELRTTQERLNGEMQLAQKGAQFEIEQAKLSGAHHVQIVDMEIAADQRKFAKEQDIIAAERQAAGENEAAAQTVANKQAALDQSVAQSAIINSQKRNNAIIADLTKEVEEASKAAMAKVHADEQTLAAAKQKGASDVELKDKAHALSVEYQNSLAVEQRNIQFILAFAHALGVQGEAIDKLRDKMQQLNAEKIKAATNDPNNTYLNPVKDNGTQFNRDLADFSQKWHDGVHDFGDGVQLVKSGFELFKNTATTLIDAYRQGAKQGGVLGGVGAVTSQAGGMLGGLSGLSSMGGMLGTIGSFAGPAGAIMSVAGGVMSMIGGMFTAAAQHIADTIKKEFDKTISNLQNGTIGLNQAIQQVEQQRADAIAQLSSKKGGKDQLNQLLQQLDSELASLKNQQKSVIDTFEQQLAQLQTGSSVLGNVLKTWTDINKQIKDYIAAGGDAVKAQQLLNLTMKGLADDAQKSLDQGNQTAIQDALNLNNLLTQRINLQKQFAATMFGLQTQDSLERRGSNAILVGTQTQQQLKDFQTQMADLDNQISLGQQKVALEGQVFDINKSVAALQASSNALTLKALKDQLAVLKDQASVVQSFYGSPAAQRSFNAALAAMNAAGSNVPVTININGTGGVDPAAVADRLSAELNRRGRYGLGTGLDMQYA